MNLYDLIPHPEEVIPHTYEKIACPEYEAVLEKYLNAAPKMERPVLIHMAGIPGTGKTTYYRTHNWVKHVLIAFDNIMEDLSGYQEDLKTLGAKQAFTNWEITARIIGYELLRRTVEARKSIFFDNGGSTQAHLDLMTNIKSFGYSTEMYYIDCSLETAIERAAAREKELNRHIPVETIKLRYDSTISKVKRYQQIVDCFYYIEQPDSFAKAA